VIDGHLQTSFLSVVMIGRKKYKEMENNRA